MILLFVLWETEFYESSETKIKEKYIQNSGVRGLLNF